MPTVFISYGREDESSARALYFNLRVAGVDAWLDLENLRPGDHWKDVTLTALRSSDYMILLISSRSVGRRGFLNTEIREALQVVSEMPRDRPFLLPARLDDCDTSHLELNDINYVDLFRSWTVGVQRILAVVKPPPSTLPTRNAPIGAQVAYERSDERQPVSGSDLTQYRTAAFVQIKAKVGTDLRFLYHSLGDERVTWRLYYCVGPWDYVISCEADDVRVVHDFVLRLREFDEVADTTTILGIPIHAS